MRLSRRVSLLGRKEKNKRLGSSKTRKKHKKLDSICENVYISNHSVKKEENDENELRRSTRVRKAPVILDASPVPGKKRRRFQFRGESDERKKKRGKSEKNETCSSSRNVEKESSGSWGDRLRDRVRKGTKKGSIRGKKKLFEVEDEDFELETSLSTVVKSRKRLLRGKRKLFKVEDDDMELETSLSTIVKSKRPGRVKASIFSKNTCEEKKSSSDEVESSENSEDEKDEEEDSIVKSEGSDREEDNVVDKEQSSENESDENNEVEKEQSSENESDENNGVGNELSSESDEDEEDTDENEVENKEEKSGTDSEENEGETSESDEDGENGEKNEIGKHIDKKKAQIREKNDEEEMRDSSESDEDGEDEEENEVDNGEGKKDAEENIENSEMNVIMEKNDNEEEKDEVVVKASDEKTSFLSNVDMELDDDNREAENIEETMKPDMQVELENSIALRENQMDSLTVGGVSTDQIEVGMFNEGPLHNENEKKSLCETRYLKVGRRCGLCGRGSDGKPPKTLVEDGNVSDHEKAYSGSSASEDVKYDSCDGFGEEPGWLGRLLGPINDRHGIAGIWVHQHCAVWSPEVYFSGLGCLKNVRAALCRGRVLKCTRCSRPGATIGCHVDRCPKTYHLPCARANGCSFDHKKFLIACTDHRHLFLPHGVQYENMIKKMKTKKLKMEMRKASGDAWRKDFEAEEKYLENCGEDEEFLKRESKRLQRDLLRIAPVFIGGSNSDNASQFQGWETVAGLQSVIQSLKEVVILPLLYPEFFSNMGLTPPRGVLLHGHPGTGKTLVVRALIGSCAHGDKRIAYFARKGADCLGKYVGDAERQLRLLFQVAEKSQPSIIFFDEIDGLAPCRTRQQDQTHNSVVSTLLALMDGLKSRGSVVVIGATNRPDSVDPALRRPGRFDREIYFPLPSSQDREAILSLHTSKWPKPVTGSLLKQISKMTVGFAGADLQALCTQSAITALRRSCPFQEILSAAEKKGSLGKLPPLPTFVVEERDWLEALRHAPPPCSQRGSEMAANSVVSSPLHTHLIPCLLRPLSVFLASLCRDERILLPYPLSKAAMLVKSVIISALDQKKMPRHKWWSHLHDMLLETDVLRDVENKLSRCGLVNGLASDSSSNVCNEESDNHEVEFHSSKVHQISTRPRLWQNVTGGSDKNLGFWCLVSGNPGSGQRYLASCILHCFTGNVEIQKLDSATISQEGQGDITQGVTRILMKCASVGSSLIFMPRIDLWAIEISSELDEDARNTSPKNSESSGQEEPEVSEMATSEDVSLKPSIIWNIFVEQVQSISVSSSLTILATSELPTEALPNEIQQFFSSGKLNNRSSSPSEETVPRFSVNLDGHFNRDTVISSSVMELSKDLVQQFVQLTHLRVHVHTNSPLDVNSCDTLEGDADNHGLAEEVVKAQFPENSSVQLSSPPNIRPSRGKSNLLTISSLGYQILRYPHFAELCWATSKLKEGPCTDTRGPWKGWPFNSCVVRPDKSSGHAAKTGSPSNIKSRENYGLVRGLIAVGLSAYRGTYTTVREVSSEVRRVLELLADQINAKIRTGKDPYHYIRLLSQMAYFEDVVNSWAYSLQSLDEDSPTMIPPTSTNFKSCDYNMPSEEIAEKKDGVEPDVSAKSSEHTTEQKDENESAKSSDPVLEKSTQNLDSVTSMENFEKGKISADEPHHLTPISCEQDGNSTEPCRLEILSNHSTDNGVCLSKLPNGFGYKETLVIDVDGPCSGVLGSKNPSTFKDTSMQYDDKMQTNISSEGRKSSPFDGQDNAESNSSAGNGNSPSKDPSVICFYRCCSECLVKLREKIGKILTCEWGLRGDDGFTVEDVHDLVGSVSMNLHLSLRKIFVAEWDNRKEEMRRDEEMGRDDNVSGVFANQEKDMRQREGSEDGSLRPKECRSHSITSSQNFQQENDLKFVCRDGVVSLFDPKEVTSLDFHCKFETICLCSLIGWIVMSKQPSG